MAGAMALAHVVKYAGRRLRGVMGYDRQLRTLLEMQTLGEEGLRYLHRFGRVASGWLHMSAVPAVRVADIR
jgi:hypothetical protein